MSVGRRRRKSFDKKGTKAVCDFDQYICHLIRVYPSGNSDHVVIYYRTTRTQLSTLR